MKKLTVAFAREVASMLDGYHVVPFLEEQGDFKMAGPDGALVTVRLRHPNLTIVGSYCDGAIQKGALLSKHKAPFITLRSNLPSGDVAREIAVRLLPLVDNLVSRCIDHAAKLASHRVGVRSTAEWIAENSGGELVTAHSRDDRDALAIEPRVRVPRSGREIMITVKRPGLVTFGSFDADENEAVNILAELK